MTEKIYLVKYALTKGIIEADAEILDFQEYKYATNFLGYKCLFLFGVDFFFDKEEAVLVEGVSRAPKEMLMRPFDATYVISETVEAAKRRVFGEILRNSDYWDIEKTSDPSGGITVIARLRVIKGGDSTKSDY